jgi:predicted phage tail protein
MVPGFEKFLTESKDRGLTYSVFIGGENIGEKQLSHPTGSEDIRIAPIVRGSKKSGLFQTILGVALLVASFFFPALLPFALSMTLGGVVSLLSPQTTGLSSQDSVANRPSYAFNGAVNTAAQGGAIPLLYGEIITGSTVVSAGIYTEDQL